MKIARLLGLILFNVLLFFVLAEVVGLVYFFSQAKTWYYSRPESEATTAQHRTSDTVVESYRLHPYFGYVLQPSRLAAAERAASRIVQNNHGFDEPRDFPYLRRDENEVIVGIFGGSVASKLTVFEHREGIIARHLAAALGKSVDDITVLNFGQGGFKQPQQLLIYTYFRTLGQELDWVINVDGFNELALTQINARNGVEIGMPSVDHVGSLRKVVGSVGKGQTLERMLAVRTAWRDYEAMEARASSGEAWELRFAAGWMVDQFLVKLYRKRFSTKVLAYSSLQSSDNEESWYYLDDQPVANGEAATEADLRRAVDLWRNASLMMHRAQTEAGGRYLHFVQPNQYHPTGRVYGEAEKAVAFADRSPYREPIERGYPLLNATVPEVRAAGVAIHAPLELFDAAEEAMYVDSCCHYTAAGETILAEAIGVAMGEMVDAQ
ncbi:MAG: hypothetical protein AAF657_10315 [Acidobacteriota bacterium]